ncbi:MAG: nucleotide sugar dehydrogenase [Planctomycetes bacterium]|nr:nucleotide sugar dehydrogenase [Planctomycetota bacterium]
MSDKTQIKRPLVCIQGVGFVGLAIATVIANSFNRDGSPLYDVVGIDTPDNQCKLDLINKGKLPFKTEDASFGVELKKAVLNNKNLVVTSEESYYSHADVVVVDIPLHIEKLGDDYSHHQLHQDQFEKAIQTLGARIKPECLVLVETTVAPGFSNRIIKKILDDAFKKRNISSSPLIAHSYERVMPGKNYLNSIRNYYRVFAGIDKRSSDRARAFIESIVNVKDYPLREEASMEASELAKVLENSFRAVNIAFIYEWTLLAEKMGVNLFSVIKGIKNRKTHNNIMEPGFGVGGYCLTKDALLALWSAKNFYDISFGLPFSKMALELNDRMPLHTVDLIQREMAVKGRKVAVLGVSYKEDIGDSRFSASETFCKKMLELGAICFAHDPYLEEWTECPDIKFVSLDNSLREMDVLVFTTRHKDYQNLDKDHLLEISRHGALVVDAFNILADDKIIHLLQNGRNVIGVGKGHINIVKDQLNWQKS